MSIQNMYLNINLKSLMDVYGPSEISSWLDIFKYPAGEYQVRVRMEGLDYFKNCANIRITSRIKCSDDLVILALLKDSLDRINPTATKDLFLPYLPYGRADRVFVEGDTFGLKVFSTLLKSMAFDSVSSLDVHSDVATDIGFTNIDPMGYIITSIIDTVDNRYDSINILFPDRGAKDRYNIPDIGVANNTKAINVRKLYCTKKRDPQTGQFQAFEVPKKDEFIPNCPILIVDDLCDGGGTFIGIVKELLKIRFTFEILNLYVTHGIFSKGLDGLLFYRSGYFDRIYTTDSYYTGAKSSEVNVYTV